MTEMELYKLWCEKAVDDPDLQTELKSIEGDEAAIQDRFYRDLEFGTGGLEELSVQAHTDLMFTLSDVQHRVLQTM